MKVFITRPSNANTLYLLEPLHSDAAGPAACTLPQSMAVLPDAERGIGNTYVCELQHIQWFLQRDQLACSRP